MIGPLISFPFLLSSPFIVYGIHESWDFLFYFLHIGLKLDDNLHWKRLLEVSWRCPLLALVAL